MKTIIVFQPRERKRSSDRVKGPKLSLLLVCVAISFLLAACQPARVESAREGSAEGEKAQDFTLEDLKGDSVSISSFLGKKTVLLDFSATWCPHCITIIPSIKNIHTKYKDVEVIAVFIKESRTTMEKFVEKHGIPYTILLDTDGSVASAYNVRGIPTVIVVGKDGIIKFRGHHVSEEMIRDGS